MTRNEKVKITEMIKSLRHHCFLATSGIDHQPNIRPMFPYIDDELNLRFTTFQSSRKVKEINTNAKVAVFFSSPPPDWDKEIIIFGTADFVTNPEEKYSIWVKSGGNLSRYFPDGPDSDDFCVINILIREIRWRDGFQSPITISIP